MKKSHIIILIITAVMALFSAYSLAAINQVYNVEFEWYSQYKNVFMDDKRNTSYDKWFLSELPKDMHFDIIGSYLDCMDFNRRMGDKLDKRLMKRVISEDYNKYALIYCSIGKTKSPEYRIKVEAIAQRGNVVEIKISMNSPTKDEEKENAGNMTASGLSYQPVDLIRIDKEAFSSKGGLYFIFKNQSGKHVLEKYYELK